MEDIQKLISEAAARYDPAIEADAQASRALLQGATLGLFLKAIHDTAEGQVPRVGACAISNITQDVDADGNYRPWFTITTGAGHRIRVTFDVVS